MLAIETLTLAQPSVLSWEERTHRSGNCSVTLVNQRSKAACVAGQSFGCDGSGRVWATQCRGFFRCGGENDARFGCGFPAGQAYYTCECAARARRERRRAVTHRHGRGCSCSTS